MTTSIRDGITEEQRKELCQLLSDMIASLGYPVGMGLAPHPFEVREMIGAIFFMHERDKNGSAR